MWFNLIAIAVIIVGRILYKYHQGPIVSALPLIGSAIALCNFIF